MLLYVFVLCTGIKLAMILSSNTLLAHFPTSTLYLLQYYHQEVYISQIIDIHYIGERKDKMRNILLLVIVQLYIVIMTLILLYVANCDVNVAKWMVTNVMNEFSYDTMYQMGFYKASFKIISL